MLLIGQSSLGITSGTCLIFLPSAHFQNLSNWLRESASALSLSADFTYLQKKRTLYFRHVNTIFLINTIQFLQGVAFLLIIPTTPMLSQKITTRLFRSWLAYSNTTTAAAYSSKYSMLGLKTSMKSGSH